MIDRSGQMEFPFPKYDERERWLNAIQFAGDRKGVSDCVLSAVLRQIGKYPESFAKQETIANAVKVRVRTIQRALHVLEQLDLVVTVRRWNEKARATLNHHRINWEELRRQSQKRADQHDNMSCCVMGQTTDQHDNVSCCNTTMTTDQHDNDDMTNTTMTTSTLYTGEQKDLSPTKEEQAGLNVALDALIERVGSIGVWDAETRITDAVRRSSLEHVTAIVDHWETNRPAWGVGALAIRLSRVRNGTDVENAWPPRESESLEEYQGRGDALTRSEVDRERIRFSIVRAGRKAGESEETIAARCAAAGVSL